MQETIFQPRPLGNFDIKDENIGRSVVNENGYFNF